MALVSHEESPPPGEPRAAASPPRVLVVGCGGIGGILAANLFEQGHDVTALTTNVLIADAINAHGFRLRGEGSPGTVNGRAVRELAPNAGLFDFVLLATQPPQVEEAARRALPALAPSGAMVCFQNGLCEERVAAIVGPDRVLGAIVAWGASMVEPGVYDRTSSGGFVLGRIEALGGDGRLEELARMLEAVGPTTISDNLIGARWSKLAINCAISSLGTVGGERLGVLMRHRFVRRLALEIMTETVLVARALGVRLEKVSGTLDLDWIALTDAERVAVGSPGLVAKHALLLAVGARFRRLRSSMLAAIERGRTPAVDFLNGEVVTRGATLGVPTPVSAAIRDEVMAVARDRRPSFDRLRGFFERTRTPVAPVTMGGGPPYPPAQPVTMGGGPPYPPAQPVTMGGGPPYPPAQPVTMGGEAPYPPAPPGAFVASIPSGPVPSSPSVDVPSGVAPVDTTAATQAVPVSTEPGDPSTPPLDPPPTPPAEG